MLDNAGMGAAVFGLEWPYTSSVWSALELFDSDHYSISPPVPNPPPKAGGGMGALGLREIVSAFPSTTDAGTTWKAAGRQTLPIPPFQAIHVKGAMIAPQPPCACAGESCGLAANLGRRGSAWGGCLPRSAGGTVPELPVRARRGRLSTLSVSLCKSVFYGAFVWAHAWRVTSKNGVFRPGQWWNFSSARALVYTAQPNGTIMASAGTRAALFHGLPRPVTNTCSRPRRLYPMPLGATGPFPDAGLAEAALDVKVILYISLVFLYT